MAGEWFGRDLLSVRAGTTPDRTAVVGVGEGETATERLSYRALDEVVATLAGVLGRGGPLGVLMDTRTAFASLVHAGFRTGRPVVPLNPDLPADRIGERARRAGVRTLVCGSGTESLALAAAESAAPDGGLDLRTVDDPSEPEVDGLTDRESQEDEAVTPGAVSPGETAIVMFTSGSTGEPKGVRLTLDNLVSSAVASAFRTGVAPGDRYLCCLPMYHMGGFATIVRTVLSGTTLVVQSGFGADRTRATLAEQGITGVSLVPTQLRRLLDAGLSPPPALETVLLGGAPARPALIERCREAGLPVYPTYGTTETASQVATARPAEAFEDPGTVGRPLLCTDVTILRDGQPAEPGETGEVVVSGPTVTPGYLDAERTAAATSEHGLHTGDLGSIGVDGRLRIAGRLDDAITTGGETVHPARVADRLRDHPGVADAAVVGVPDEEWGERVGALVVPTEDSDHSTESEAEHRLDAADLRSFARDRLPGYAVPRSVAVVESLPTTVSGTVDREAVRRRLR